MDIKAQTAKLASIDLRRPIKFTSQPDIKPPVKPPIPKNIMLNPRSFGASTLNRLCIQVGIHEKSAHIPISMVPNTTEPITSAFKLEPENNGSVGFSLSDRCDLRVSHISDSLIIQIPAMAMTTGMAPIKNPCLQELTKKLINPAEKIPTGKAMDMALEVLKKLHMNGLTAEQLSSAKSYLKGQFPPMIETSGQLARLIVRYEFLGLDDNEVNQFEQRIDGVTPELAKQVIAKHFPSENLAFVLVGKSSEIAPMVKKYAEKQDAKEIAAPGFWAGPK